METQGIVIVWEYKQERRYYGFDAIAAIVNVRT